MEVERVGGRIRCMLLDLTDSELPLRLPAVRWRTKSASGPSRWTTRACARSRLIPKRFAALGEKFEAARE
jgi:hypothetical protein